MSDSFGSDSEVEKPNKVLLMGRAKAGKTSMKSIIFANYMAKDTERLGPTIRIAHSTLRFLGNLQLDLWDCGGQERFLANYFAENRARIFSNVAVLIYVFDIVSLRKQKKSPTADANDLIKFENTCSAMSEFSPNAHIFVLIHKMDTISSVEMKKRSFHHWSEIVKRKARLSGLTVKCHATSIWDESLFGAWSNIVCSLLPDARKVSDELDLLCQVCGAEEIVLFEASTLLFVKSAYRSKDGSSSSAMIESSSNGGKHQTQKSKTAKKDVETMEEDGSGGESAMVDTEEMESLDNSTSYNMQRQFHFEKIVNVVKRFRLRCQESLVQFSTIRMSNEHFSSYLGPFTPSTYILLVISDSAVQMDAALINVNAAKERFTQLLALAPDREDYLV